MLKLDYNAYTKKLKGCFAGKAVGGTLGMPLEGYVGTKEITYYDSVPNGMIENDDIDLQVVWLEVIRRRGLPVNRLDLAEGWLRHVRGLFDEYGVAVRNLETGLYPPLSGYYGNKFYAGMGSAIRTEIWAALAPGDPALAVSLAREDACVDHYADGVDASSFLAAMESAAYIETDIQKLINTGLSFLDENGRLYRALTSVICWWDELKEPLAVRERILSSFFSQNWTDVSINISFIILSLLSSDGNFSKGICTAAGLGHDADCTAATVGALMGILNPDGIEERWTKPLGDSLILSGCISNMHEVSTIHEFCSQIAVLCQDTQEFYNSSVRFFNAPIFKRDYAKPWSDNTGLSSFLKSHDIHESLISLRPLAVTLRYPDDIAIAPGKTETFTARIVNPAEKSVDYELNLGVPFGWNVEPFHFVGTIEQNGEVDISFCVTAPENSRRRIPCNDLDFKFTVNGLSVEVSAGLVQTIDFLRIAADKDPQGCPPEDIFIHAEMVSAATHFQKVPEGRYYYVTEIRPSFAIQQAIIAAQGTRPMKVWYDGKLVLDHDGCEYVPAFHRSDYIVCMDMSAEWHRIVIWVGGKNDYNKNINRSPQASLVKVDGCPSTFSLRKKYDKTNWTMGEEGELFFGVAHRYGYRWISDLEWRVPHIKNRSY